MRPTLRQLQYLVATADTGRFSDAAKLLNVSQPSLSAQIAEAEAHLGVIVFERGRHGASLTPLGAEIIRRGRYVLRQMEDMKSIASNGRVGLYGRVRLGVLPTIGPYLLPRCTAGLHRAFPDLRLSIREESTVELQEKLIDGRMDVVISTPQDHAQTRSEHLFNESLWVAVPVDHPLADSTGPVRLDALAGQPLLSLGMGHRLAGLVAELAHQVGAYISTDYEGTSLDAIRHMSALGAGIAILPELYVACEARRDATLVYRRIAHASAQRDIALIWREASPLQDGFTDLAAALRAAATPILGVGNNPVATPDQALTSNA